MTGDLCEVRGAADGDWDVIELLREAGYLDPVDDPEDQLRENSKKIHYRDDSARSAYCHCDADRLPRFWVCGRDIS